MPHHRSDITCYVWHQEFQRRIFTIHNFSLTHLSDGHSEFWATNNKTNLLWKKQKWKLSILGSSQMVRDSGLKLDVRFPNQSSTCSGKAVTACYSHSWLWPAHTAATEAPVTAAPRQRPEATLVPAHSCCLLPTGILFQCIWLRSLGLKLAPWLQGGRENKFLASTWGQDTQVPGQC